MLLMQHLAIMQCSLPVTQLLYLWAQHTDCHVEVQHANSCLLPAILLAPEEASWRLKCILDVHSVLSACWLVSEQAVCASGCVTLTNAS